MPQILQHRRGTTAEISSEAGSIGEFWMDESKNTIVVMDGSTSGGHPLAKFSDIPINVSDLTNDAGYITSAAVFSGSYTDLSDVPTTFTPNTHNQDWSTITNTPTTIAGYGITDAPPTYDQSLNTSSNVEFLSVSSSNISTTAIVTSNNDINITINNDDSSTYVWNFSQTGDLIFPSNSGRINLQVSDGSGLQIEANTDFEIKVSGGGNTEIWSFEPSGNIIFPDATIQSTAYPGPQATFDGDVTGSVYANNDVLLVDGENGVLNTHALSQVNAENGQPLLWSTSLTRWQPGSLNYGSLTNTPTIPADVGDLTDTTNLLFSGNYGDLTGKPNNNGVAYQYGYSAHDAVSTAGNDFTVDGVTMSVSLTASANAQGARINISGITTNSSAGTGLIYVQRRVNTGSWNVWNSFVVDGAGDHISHSFVDFYDTGGTSLDANTGDTVEYKLTNGTNDSNYNGNSSAAVDFELFFGFQFTATEIPVSYSLTQP